MPRGTRCGCTPFPELSASALNVPHTREVKATNDAVGGFTSADVLRQLSADADVVSDVANADVVEIEVGANDVGYRGSCGTSVGCYQTMITATQRNLSQDRRPRPRADRGAPSPVDLVGLLERMAWRSVRH